MSGEFRDCTPKNLASFGASLLVNWIRAEGGHNSLSAAKGGRPLEVAIIEAAGLDPREYLVERVDLSVVPARIFFRKTEGVKYLADLPIIEEGS